MPLFETPDTNPLKPNLAQAGKQILPKNNKTPKHFLEKPTKIRNFVGLKQQIFPDNYAI